MKLIDADVLMADVRNTITEESGAIDWINLINRQPTAYDPDKVVEQLKTEDSKIEIQYENNYEKGLLDGIGKAIEIAKGGGVDE